MTRVDQASEGTWEFTNALINQSSPYLLQHAHNPVDWHPWGAASLELAQRSGRPIFLSIGYSTCYWCHVMERLVFEVPKIAAKLNEEFICIKVDREERPDIDDIYMAAVQLMTGRGGWPMSLFLTPPGAEGKADTGLRPFYAATYIPPEPSHGMPGFSQLTHALAQAWQTKKSEVIAQSHRVADAVREQVTAQQSRPVPLGKYIVTDAAEALLKMRDAVHGGFGGAPKFPQAGNLALLLHVQKNEPQDAVRQPLIHALDRMARGGIYDQLAGGFHRYSTDEKWLVPHFEKMLYDNGQLLEIYALAHEILPEESQLHGWPRVMQQTWEYLQREMVDASGGGAFWSAQDAEVDAREGGNYVWTSSELKVAIAQPALRELALKMYGVDLGPNFSDPHHPDALPVNVLFLPMKLDDLARKRKITLDQLLEMKKQIDEQLMHVRAQRKQPGTDDKVLTSWNGLAIAGLAQAGRVLKHSEPLSMAKKAVEAVLAHLSSADGGLLRTFRSVKDNTTSPDAQAKIPGFLEDYAFFVHGLIELYRASGDKHLLDHAVRLTEHAIRLFAAPDGGYFDTLDGQRDLLVRTQSTYDGAIPCGNSRMTKNLLDLHAMTNESKFYERALRDLTAASMLMTRRGATMVQMVEALLTAIDSAPSQSDPFVAERPDESLLRTRPLSVELHEKMIDLASGSAAFSITLHLGDEYHLTAPAPGSVSGSAPGSVPGSDEYADGIPVRLALKDGDGCELLVTYPAGEMKKYSGADKAVHVYEASVTLHGTLRRVGAASADAKQKPTLVLHYQLCTQSSCLEAREYVLPVEIC